MGAWQPASREEVEQLLSEELGALHPGHRVRFDAMRVPPHQVPVTSHPGEFVYVVAEYDGKVLYYSDVEDGWELEALDDSGGIGKRGGNQFKLSHIMHQLFGAPDATTSAGAMFDRR
jgi:hypothetical protein